MIHIWWKAEWAEQCVALSLWNLSSHEQWGGLERAARKVTPASKCERNRQRPGWPRTPEQPVTDDDGWSSVWARIPLCACVCTCLYTLYAQASIQFLFQRVDENSRYLVISHMTQKCNLRRRTTVKLNLINSWLILLNSQMCYGWIFQNIVLWKWPIS